MYLTIFSKNDQMKIMNLIEIGQRIRVRREVLGLSQDRLAKLGGLSRVTINHLETGNIVDLGVTKLLNLLDLLGLTLSAATKPETKSGLRMASRTASVSYKNLLSASDLSRAMADGTLTVAIVPHIATLLDEAPLSIIVSAVEEASAQQHVAPKKIWRNLIHWAHALQSTRKVWA
jgi:transcriptional regulator with XRE-family HTH domain